jgi:hypothetical protein
MRTSPASAPRRILDAIRDHNHVLIPGQYIGIEPVEGDGRPLDEKIARLTAGIGD